MPLINAKGAEIADLAGLTLHPLAELPTELPAPAGVVLPPNAELAAILPRLGELAVIAVEFPKFRDGRGFSIARSLREHHGYKGDLRATGHFLPDQFAFLLSCLASPVSPRRLSMRRRNSLPSWPTPTNRGSCCAALWAGRWNRADPPSRVCRNKGDGSGQRPSPSPFCFERAAYGAAAPIIIH